MDISAEERASALRVDRCDDIERMNLADWEVYDRLWQAQREELPGASAADVTRRLRRRLLGIQVAE